MTSVHTFEQAMSDREVPSQLDAVLAAQELQSRFVSDNLRGIFLFIYRIVRNVDDAQDLTQEAFIKALQRQDQLKDIEKASHWLSRIASNTAIDFLRRNGKVNFCDVDSLIEPLSEPSASPEQAVLRSEHRAYLEQMREECAERRVPVFDPIPRRHSYLSLSTAGQDYLPVAGVVAGLLQQQAVAAHA